MNTSRLLQVALIATTSFFGVSALSPTRAATFDTQEVNSNNFIVLATPVNGNNQHQLLILEQISNKRLCWTDGSTPGTIDPLLLKFDFTGVCGRSTDSNGYSIRMGSEDLGLDYLLRVVQRNGKLALVGSHRVNRQMPDIEIGSTNGMTEGFEKIVLNPGWRLTRRTYKGKPLGHIYITTDAATPPVTPSSTAPSPLPSNPLPAAPAPSSPLPATPAPSPLPGTPQSLPSNPERELIFTKPQTGSMAPKAPTSATSSQGLTPPGSASTLPEFVVPTLPQAGSMTPTGIPATGTPTLSSPPTSERQIPVFVVPTN